MINVISIHLFKATIHHRPFTTELFSIPVVIEVELLVYLHGINKKSRGIVLCRATTDNPITSRCSSPDPGLACGEGTVAMERVWSKSIIPNYNIREASHDLLFLSFNTCFYSSAKNRYLGYCLAPAKYFLLLSPRQVCQNSTSLVHLRIF